MMAGRLPPEYREQFRHLDNLVTFTEQESSLDRVVSALNGVGTFLDWCVRLREALLAGECVPPIPEGSLDALVDECSRALLCAVPAASRAELRSRSRCDVPPPTSLAPEIAPVAEAELRLRRFVALCIESAGERFRGETRLPKWDRLHGERLAELASTVAAWEAVEARPGDRAVPR